MPRHSRRLKGGYGVVQRWLNASDVDRLCTKSLPESASKFETSRRRPPRQSCSRRRHWPTVTTHQGGYRPAPADMVTSRPARGAAARRGVAVLAPDALIGSDATPVQVATPA